ncbi:hypothetical protein ISF_04443 [Cordyceps fumosorosea ARSEF 2679]|uniref:Mcm2 3 5 family protein n=1 Tax=Cordyceps fumosorosea (strain ARSEF 2679) TaxID=1081104 RepID=A0A167XJ32_CORFA|nr:hypothetical protein ISF_04443 [Cordyceps fumosorosea ARSEF 2679]OAA65033.1 hypothetical protein ISF_04443 [Cordyceps fumosorosea ARSEF 2679]
MAHSQPPRSVSPDNEERTWLPEMTPMNFDGVGDGPHRMPSVSFSLGRSRSIRESDTYNWQNEATDLLLTSATGEASAPNDSTANQNNLSRHSSHHGNPLRLSHQDAEFEMVAAPVMARTGSIRSRSSVRASPGGMPSPDDTLVEGSSPPRASRWGLLWKFRSKGLHHRVGSKEALTTNMSPIAGAGGLAVAEDDDGDSDAAAASNRNGGHVSEACSSRKPIQSPKADLFTKFLIGMSLYSTTMSGVFIGIAFEHRRWGRLISSHSILSPSKATSLTAFLSKTIEMTFATAFMTVLGQALTRRAIANGPRGTTLAEISMRSWVIQPGALFWQSGRRQALFSILGILSVVAAVVTTFYTTASEATVAPKLKFGSWEDVVLSGYVRASYANPQYVHSSCQTMLRSEEANQEHATMSCTDVMISGESYRNLQAFMNVWADINTNGSSNARDVKDRPAGTATLNGTTTLYGTWIETENSNVTAHFEKTKRIINNVTLAMPHPGVAYAAMSSLNDIMQPRDLDGVGEYAVKAGVVSPAVNVLCINMKRDELAPLVYTEWPFANNTRTGLGEQQVGWENWTSGVPPAKNSHGDADYLNRTVVDDLFRWGPKYMRRPPVFRLFPADYNTVVNPIPLLSESDAIYIMGKSPSPDLKEYYAMCELRSWVSPRCSTQFNISGITGSKLVAHCEDPKDLNSYRHSFDVPPKWEEPSPDWKRQTQPQNLADQWRTASDLNGGERNSNPANSRILTQLILPRAELQPHLPSLAEALAVFASSTLVLGSVDSPFEHYWRWPAKGNILGAPGMAVPFNASMATQQYTSSSMYGWQSMFYAILVIMFILNCLCLVYIIIYRKPVTDFTDAHNLFVLALNSAPSDEIKGSCGGGPEGIDWVVPWRVGLNKANHYFIETNRKNWSDICDQRAKKDRSPAANFDRLSKSNPLL